jgi:two-component system, chemotaxis family, chemotaxis protein CheY
LATIVNFQEKSNNARRILIVDDSPTIRRMVSASLRGLSGLKVDEAASGLEAIERIGLDLPNLVILDLNMPDMHGLEVLEFMRKHHKYRETPVMVLTTRDDSSSRDAVLSAGANVYMTKPFSPEELQSQARHLLGIGRQPAAQEISLG